MADFSDPAGISAAVQAIEPAARFVPLRALRRAIRQSRDRGEFRAVAVHDQCWWVEREVLANAESTSELGLVADDTTSRLLLLPLPDEPIGPRTWNDLWRRLFHAAIDRDFDVVPFDVNALKSLRSEFGPATWHAIRVVLLEENLISEDDGDREVAREFVAFAAELIAFRPHDWSAFFPGLQPTADPVRSLLSLVDTDRLVRQTRPGPAIDSFRPHEPNSPTLPIAARPFDRRRIENLTSSGNDLRAAIACLRSGDTAAAETSLHRLVERLSVFLELTANEVADWQSSLRALLAPAALGWTLERRLIYEVQRACLAVEKPVFAVSLFESLVSFGRRPIKRPLPRTKWVEAHRRLRAALRFAEKLPHDDDEPPILHLLERAAAGLEQKARDDLRTPLIAVLDDIGLEPRSIAEQISRAQLVEELLDGACARGFLRFGDLRDALARNRVKLPDLAGPIELVRGDPLIRANRQLPIELDGVYRRGEIYMRALQRGCSIFFGTRIGRLLTRFVALPFGGAFLLVEAVNHMVEAGDGFVNWVSGWSATVKGVSALAGGAAGTLAENPTLDPGDVSLTAVLTVGVVLFLLLHWPAFRGRAIQVAKTVLVRLPRAAMRSPTLRAIFVNRFTHVFRRYLFIPLAVGALAGFLLHVATDDWASACLVGGGVSLFMGSFFRTPFGRGVEDRLDEAASRLWRIVSVNFVIGLVTLILQFFQAVFHFIDQTIYAVDEWLRFREGQSRATFVFKVLFGALWSVFTYVFRFAWTLLVEPQINPIKHFPVVTVSHKMLLPLIPSLAKQFRIAEETMGTIVFGIPGIFGFLVWELKENWKLYRANASPTIQPAIVGAHGERVRRLLRPGFHSGVVPKTFAKLRRAVRAGNRTRVSKLQHGLEHIAESVHRLVERSFVPFLRQIPQWRDYTLRAELPTLTPNKLLLPIVVGDQPDRIVLSIEERGGWIIGSVAHDGPLQTMTDDARSTFASALAGLYKLAGIHAIREQAASVFGDLAYSFDANPEGLIVRLPNGSEQFFAYNDGPELMSPTRQIPAKTLVFSDCPLNWTDWTEYWQAAAAGKSTSQSLMADWTLLRPRVAS